MVLKNDHRLKAESRSSKLTDLNVYILTINCILLWSRKKCKRIWSGLVSLRNLSHTSKKCQRRKRSYTLKLWPYDKWSKTNILIPKIILPQPDPQWQNFFKKRTSKVLSVHVEHALITWCNFDYRTKWFSISFSAALMMQQQLYKLMSNLKKHQYLQYHLRQDILQSTKLLIIASY